LRVPEVLSINVPAVGTAPGGISDGQRFTISDGKRTVVFEFDTNGTPPALPIRTVTIGGTSTPDQIADAIVASIHQAVSASALVGLAPKNIGDGRVHVGATNATSVSVLGSNLTLNVTQRPLRLVIPQAGVGPGGIADGQTFVVTNGAASTTFEFDNNALLNGN